MRPGAIDTAERPFVLIWELTQACDLACEHCRADAEPERHPRELSTAEGETLLDEVARFGDGQLVVLSGGDPLVRDDAVELVEHGVDRGLRMTMTPSGTSSLTREAIEALSGVGLRRMALSIDGADADSHDAFRGEPGSFEATVEAARDVRAAGLPLQVNTTVCARTVEDLPAIAELVADLGAVLWSVFFLVPVGRGRLLDPISPERAESVMEWLVDLADDAPFGVKTTEAPHYRRVAIQRGDRSGGTRPGGGPTRPDDESSTRPAGSCDTDSAAGGPPTGHGGSGGSRDGGPPDGIGRRTGITAGDGFAFVSHVGDVYPSGFLPESAGNVRERSVVDIYRDADLFERLRDPDALEGKCGACPYRGACGGSRSRAHAYTGDPLASDPLCSFVPEDYDGPLPEQAFGDRGAGPSGRSSAGD